MKIKPYYDYLKYVLEHKKNVFIECWKEGLYLHAFTHDFSKFSKYEFKDYAKFFYIDKEKYKDDFDTAWVHHYKNNPHHWNYWVQPNGECYKMSTIYLKQMICDWKAMSRKFGDTAQAFYLKNYKKIQLHRDSRFQLEAMLGLCGKWFCEGDKYYWCTIEEIVDECLEYKENNPHNFSNWFENEFLKEYKDKYGIDLLKVLGKSLT